jgi:hypothetical protein
MIKRRIDGKNTAMQSSVLIAYSEMESRAKEIRPLIYSSVVKC